MIHYDENIVISFARKLYNQADLTVFMYIVLGALLGAFFGFLLSDLVYVLDIAISADPNLVGMAVGAVIFGLIGLMIGLGRAFQLKLQAQVALCQVQIERNTKLLYQAQKEQNTRLSKQFSAQSSQSDVAN